MNDPVNEHAVRPWYREPWPWIIIGLLGTVIIASLVTLWIAASNPDGLVVDEGEYQEIRRGLRAQETGPAPAEGDADPDDPGDGGG